ncbi:hypothetical protein BH10ACI1_BH10ACI1_05130 [soil metagenome]
MEQTTVIVKIPKTLSLSELEIKMTLASRLYETGKITSGQAAEMVGLSKRAFIELLGKYNVSVFGYTLDEEDLSVL